MKSQALHTVWFHISCETTRDVWNWSLLGVKGLNTHTSHHHWEVQLVICQILSKMDWVTQSKLVFFEWKSQVISCRSSVCVLCVCACVRACACVCFNFEILISTCFYRLGNVMPQAGVRKNGFHDVLVTASPGDRECQKRHWVPCQGQGTQIEVKPCEMIIFNPTCSIQLWSDLRRKADLRLKNQLSPNYALVWCSLIHNGHC